MSQYLRTQNSNMGIKFILTGLSVFFLNSFAFAQIEKPKPAPTTTQPKTKTPTPTPVSKGIATVEVTWKGPGAAKIIIGTNEFFLSAGGKNTIKLNAGEVYTPKVS